MNMTNQTTSSLMQIRLQIPIQYLKTFANALNELVEMYPFEEEEEEKEEENQNENDE